MSGIITIVASKKVENGAYRRAVSGNAQRKYLQTTPGGGSPGAVDVGETEAAISFGALDSPAIVRIENLSSEYDVQWGPEDTGAMVVVGTLRKRVLDGNGNEQYSGGIALFELEAGVTLRMVIAPDTISSSSGSGSESPLARVQVDAEDF